MRRGYDISFTMGLHIHPEAPRVGGLGIQPSVKTLRPVQRGSGSVSRPGLPGDFRFPVGYGVHLCRTTD